MDLSLCLTDPRTNASNQRSDISFSFGGNAPSLRESNCSVPHQSINAHSLTVSNKEQIKNLHIKNSIRSVILSGLSLTNREAIEALKHCCNNTFVTRVDLSHNNLTPQLLGLLKRERVNSKYLKNIKVKGMSLDAQTLKK